MGERRKIKLVSTGLNTKGVKTGYYKTTTRSDKPKQGGVKPPKMSKMSFDPRAVNEKTGKLGAHVLFEEDKIKS